MDKRLPAHGNARGAEGTTRLRRKLGAPRLLIVGCGDIGLRIVARVHRRFRVFALTSSPPAWLNCAPPAPCRSSATSIGAAPCCDCTRWRRG
jgi:hypothetical protein